MVAWILAAMIAMGTSETITIREWEWGNCQYSDQCAMRDNFSASWYTVSR